MPKVLNIDNLRSVAKKMGGKLLDNKYLGVTAKYLWRCKEGHEWMALGYAIRNGRWCPICANKTRNLKRQPTLSEYISKAKIVHGDRYDYRTTKYINSYEKIEIVCRKHGSFWQAASSHLLGFGCRQCKILSNGEKQIKNFLSARKIKYVYQYSDTRCKNEHALKFDFYLPNHRTLIEFDGKQHFQPIDYFGGVSAFEDLKKRDSIKNEFCQKRGINLVRVPYYEKDIESFLCTKIRFNTLTFGVRYQIPQLKAVA